MGCSMLAVGEVIAILGVMIAMIVFVFYVIYTENAECNPVRIAVKNGASSETITLIAALRIDSCDLPDNISVITRTVPDKDLQVMMWSRFPDMTEREVDDLIRELRMKYGEAYN